jgi:hypothetical protein
VSRVPAPLKAILIVGAIQSIAWNLVTPPFQGPDESTHYAYIQHLAETGNLPSPQTQVSALAAHKPFSTEEREAMRWLNLEPLVSNHVDRPE